MINLGIQLLKNMNIFLKKFISKTFKKPYKALDLGAGKFIDVKELQRAGWMCTGVDENIGVNLEVPYLSKNGRVNLVFSNYVLHRINNKQQFINTAYNNLKKNGWFFMHTFDKSDKSNKSNITENRLKQMLNKEGFRNISTSVFDYKDNEHNHKIIEITAQK